MVKHLRQVHLHLHTSKIIVMNYFQVKKESDQCKHNICFRNNFFIANELFTQNEVSKSGHSDAFIKKHLMPVKLSPKATYFLFGARFTNALNNQS